MKICCNCKLEKLEEDFHKNSSRRGGLQSTCKVCSSKRDLLNYHSNTIRRSSVRDRAKENIASNRRFIDRYKRFCSCRLCGEKEPIALDLHHLDPLGKDANVAHLHTGSRKRIKNEIRKCVVLCSNCHRKVHAGISFL